MSIFAIAHKKTHFVHVVYIFKLNILLENIVEKLSKEIAQELCILCCPSLSIDRGHQLHRNLQMLV